MEPDYYDGYGVGHADAADKYMDEVARLRAVINVILVAPELEQHDKLREWIRGELESHTDND